MERQKVKLRKIEQATISLISNILTFITVYCIAIFINLFYDSFDMQLFLPFLTGMILGFMILDLAKILFKKK